VIQAALLYADPGGQVSEGSEYDNNRATELLRHRGWIDFEDFPARNEDGSNEGDFDEVGWNVEIAFRAMSSLADARQAMLLMISRVADFEDFDCSNFRLVALYLLIGAQPSSARFARIKYRYRHTDYPSGGEQAVLQFRTSDNKEIELSCSTDFQIL
jgi:hypothetical protein